MRPLGIACLLVLSASCPAYATGFTDIGQDIEARAKTEFDAHGSLRLRGETLYNLDLDRGLTPSGEPLFPVPLADPGAQILTGADMRLRTDLSFYVPEAALAVKLRLDVIDNLALGSLPNAPPMATSSQTPPEFAFRVKRAYGEVLLPVGLLSAGRMGSHWGLGMLTNGGDCADCDSGDAADRIAFVTAMAGHIWALAYDFSSSGPYSGRRDGQRVIDLDPTDDVRTVTFAFMRYYNDKSRARRRRSGKTTVEYGAYASYRWQRNDVPSSYLSLANPVEPLATQVMARGLWAAAFDVWFRLTCPVVRIEFEAALMLAHIDQPSLIPGALLNDSLDSTQYGAAIETEYGAVADALHFGIDLGLASGDPAYGFGAYPGASDPAAHKGDLDGPQAVPPGDNRVDNFRFHPDYRIDRILFHEIIGTVTDAVYVRPHLRLRILDIGPGHLSAGLAAVASWALYASSTPGGSHALGVEIDPTLAYETDFGFDAVLEYGLLVPLAGLDNVTDNLAAKPAQLVRLRLSYGF
jgi:uncharacterized protein (TIGR04551 family)